MAVTLADKEAVRNLIGRQKFATDDRDAKAVSNCWASGARMELQTEDKPPVICNGREEIMAFVLRGWEHTSHPHVHLITTLEIIDEPDGGVGALSYCQYLASDGSMRIHGYGRYRDRFVFEAGAWRIASRTVRISAIFRPAGGS